MITKYTVLSFAVAGLLWSGCSETSSPVASEPTTPQAETVSEPTTPVSDNVSEDDTTSDMRPLRDGEKMARCVIKPDRYDGECVFLAQANGSFSISRRDESSFDGGVTMVTVWVTAPGEADVSGLTVSGNNSRWGAATRSTDDPACWVGSDFEVCAY